MGAAQKQLPVEREVILIPESAEKEIVELAEDW